MDIRKQAMWNTAGNGVYLLALWLLTVVTTQLLGYAAAGDLTLAMAVGNVFALMQMYGVRGFQGSDVAFQYSAKDYLCVRLVTVVLGLVLCFAAALILGYSDGLLASVLLFLLFKSSESFSDALFGEDQRHNRLELAGYSMLLRGILAAAIFFAGAYFFRNLNTALLLAAATAILLTLLFDLPLFRRAAGVPWSVAPCAVRSILIRCFPLFISTLIPTVVTAVPRVALERFNGAEALGYYGNVSTPALLVTTVVPTVLTAFLPRYGRAAQEGDRRQILRIWALTALGVTAFGAVCCLGALVLARPVLALFYTEAILPYVHYLYPLLGAMTLYALTMCSSTALIAMRENRILIVSALLTLILCLGISFPLVRTLGMGGAVAALAISYGIQATLQAVCLLRLCRGRKGIK